MSTSVLQTGEYVVSIMDMEKPEPQLLLSKHLVQKLGQSKRCSLNSSWL